MSNYRVASRYAKSLIDLSQEKDSLDTIKDDMALFQEAVAQNRDLALLLRSPIVAPETKAEVLQKIFSGKVSDLTSMFFNIICKKERAEVLESIVAEFLNQYNKVKGVVKAHITTAVKLTDAASARAKGAVKEATSASEVILISKVDEGIIGGFLLKIEDRQLDDSVKGRLQELRNTLVQ